MEDDKYQRAKLNLQNAMMAFAKECIAIGLNPRDEIEDILHEEALMFADKAN